MPLVAPSGGKPYTCTAGSSTHVRTCAIGSVCQPSIHYEYVSTYIRTGYLVGIATIKKNDDAAAAMSKLI